MTMDERKLDIEKRKLKALEGIRDELRELRKSIDILEKRFAPEEDHATNAYADFFMDENS